MPIYEYRCLDCKKNFEALIIRSDDKVPCPHCNGDNLKRLMSACSFKSDGEFTSPASSSGCATCSSTNCSSCR